MVVLSLGDPGWGRDMCDVCRVTARCPCRSRFYCRAKGWMSGPNLVSEPQPRVRRFPWLFLSQPGGRSCSYVGLAFPLVAASCRA